MKIFLRTHIREMYEQINEILPVYVYTGNNIFTISHDGDCSGRNYVLIYGLWGYCSII